MIVAGRVLNKWRTGSEPGASESRRRYERCSVLSVRRRALRRRGAPVLGRGSRADRAGASGGRAGQRPYGWRFVAALSRPTRDRSGWTLRQVSASTRCRAGNFGMGRLLAPCGRGQPLTAPSSSSLPAANGSRDQGRALRAAAGGVDGATSWAASQARGEVVMMPPVERGFDAHRQRQAILGPHQAVDFSRRAEALGNLPIKSQPTRR